MGLPDKLKIAGFEIPVTERKELARQASIFGAFDPMKMTIGIEKDLCDQNKSEVLMHEVIEAINSIYDLGMSHNAIQVLGVTLRQFLLDNNIEWMV